jgi:hypothetical protein
MIDTVKFVEHLRLSEFAFYVSERIVAPFKQAHSTFYQFMIQLCNYQKKFIVLAGSAALDQEIRRIHFTTIEPQDIDFFTSLYVTEEEMNDVMVALNYLDDEYYYEADRNPCPEDQTYRKMSRIRDVWNFTVRSKDEDDELGEVLTPPIQLIVIDVPLTRCYPRGLKDFTDDVLSLFDINICKCALLSPDFCPVYATPSAQFGLVDKLMEYDLRRFNRSKVMIRRIQKYLKRGFKLTRMRLSELEYLEPSPLSLDQHLELKSDEDGISVGRYHMVEETDEDTS